MDGQTFPWGRIAAACVAVLVLILAGVVWLGVANELTRQQLAALARAVQAIPPSPPPVDAAGLTAQVKAVRESLDKLSSKVDALRGRDDAKTLDRLAGEVRALAAKVEALSAPKTPAKAGKGAKSAPPPPSHPAPVEQGGPPRPFFGPGYPAWPGY